MALSDWTTLAIAGGVAVVAAAAILRTLSRPLTFAHHWQRQGDFAVFDALVGFGLKRRAKPGRLQLAVYVTLRKVPLESGEGDAEAADRAARTRPARATSQISRACPRPRLDTRRRALPFFTVTGGGRARFCNYLIPRVVGALDLRFAASNSMRQRRPQRGGLLARMTIMANDEMMAQMSSKGGFIAALDQSGGSTPGALRLYGIPDSAYSGDAEMFALMHEMRVRIMTAPAFTGDKVIGAILFERTMDGEAKGKPVPTYPVGGPRRRPFLKVDKGLEAEADGVSLMKPIPGLDTLLDAGGRSSASSAPRCARRSTCASQDRHRRDRAAAVRDRRRRSPRTG